MITPDLFFQLTRMENFRAAGRSEIEAYRGRAAAALAYCAGLRLPEILALRRRHWCPDFSNAVRIDGDRVDGVTAREARPRIVPISPVARYMVGQYLQAFPAYRREPELCELSKLLGTR